MKSNKLLLVMGVLTMAIFVISCAYKMNTEKVKHEIKAQVIESFTRTASTADELQSAISSGDSEIRINTSFESTRTFYINHTVNIRPASESNSIFFRGSGSLFVVQKGGSLTIDAMVVGTNINGSRVITIQNGGRLAFRRTSIIDCSPASNDTGIVIESGGIANMYSSWILNASTGIYVNSGATLSFENPDESGRTNTISGCGNGIYYANLTGTANLNRASIRLAPNASVGGNTNGVVVADGTGTLNISAGTYTSNGNAIVANKGTVNISGGTISSSSQYGVLIQGATVNQTGGAINSNKYGVGINNVSTSKFVKTNGTISGNSTYAIYQNNSNDGSCRITGGTTSGVIFLAQNDNYVNTYSSYPTFTVTPSAYWLGRKLVKTDSNAVAKNEFGKVTMTPNGSWYKYINGNDQFIVVWAGGNIYVNHINKYTNEVLSRDHLNGDIGKTWASSAKTISGYKLFSAPATTSGTYTSKDDVTINYQYVKVSNVVTKYVDENYGTVLLTDTKSWGQGENYTTEKKTIDGYVYTKDSGNTATTMGDSDLEVIYYYKKISEGVDIRFIDQVKGTEIATTQHLPGLEKDPFTVKALDIPGYVLVSPQDTISGEMMVDKTIVTFEYRKLSDVTIKYVDINDKIIAEADVQNLKEGDEYTTTAKEIENYELVTKPDNANGIVGDKDIEIVYVYDLIKGKITITKVDSNDDTKVLSGAVYKIERLDSNGNIDTEFTAIEKTTEADGKVEFLELYIGKYRITEVKAPEGYELAQNAIEIEITKDNKDINIKATDRLKLILPQTGKFNFGMFISLAGISIITIAIIRNKKFSIKN